MPRCQHSQCACCSERRRGRLPPLLPWGGCLAPSFCLGWGGCSESPPCLGWALGTKSTPWVVVFCLAANESPPEVSACLLTWAKKTSVFLWRKAEIPTTACKSKGLKEKDKYHIAHGKTQSDHVTFSSCPAFSTWEGAASIHEDDKGPLLACCLFFFFPVARAPQKAEP